MAAANISHSVARSSWDKALFLFIYALFWAVVCIIVHLWPTISRGFNRIKQYFRSKRALRLSADSGEGESKALNGVIVGQAPLTPSEVKTLRGLLGSLQWLVAQVRFDIGFQVSTLQSAPHTVSALLQANKAVIDAKKNGDFFLKFGHIPLKEGGVVVVSVAALGNVDNNGCISGEPSKKVFSQSCYIVLLGDQALLSGKQGRFSVLDYRSHRIPRVARSSYAAETLGAEEGLDAGELARGFLAEALGYPAHHKNGYLLVTNVPLTGVTDAKDCYDRVTSDVGFGNQKSLMFSIANIRQRLRRPQTQYRWTSTQNMFIDCGTKMTDSAHFRQTVQRGQWPIEYQPEFIKRTYKKKKDTDLVNVSSELPGRDVGAEDFELMNHVDFYALSAGWHYKEKENIAGGVYRPYKDKDAVGSVREVLLAGFDGEPPEEGLKIRLGEKDSAHSCIASPSSLQDFLILQKELRAGFAEDTFQERLRKLQEQCERGELAKTKFLAERLKLFLTVQSKVLPRYGYEGTSNGNNPSAVALVVPDTGRSSKEISYQELGACVDEVSECLISLGISCEAVVALMMDRCAGAAFLPIDNDAPLARKQFLLHESEAAALIAVAGDETAHDVAVEMSCHFLSLPTTPSDFGRALKLQRRQRSRTHSFTEPELEVTAAGTGNGSPYRRPEAHDMALLIYTSGTTGAPKGIVYDHSHLMHGVHFFGEQCQLAAWCALTCAMLA
eukprot:g32105.t1